MPAGARALIKWVNGLIAGRIGKSGKAFGTMPALVLITVGRKTGAERRTPLAYFPDGTGAWLVVAAYAGAARNPAWYHNLAAQPGAGIELDGQTHQVIAEELHGHERDLAWKQITEANGRFGKYQDKTDRRLPVIRLSPRATAGKAPR